MKCSSDTPENLAKQYELSVDMTLFRSDQNTDKKTDESSTKWLHTIRKELEPTVSVDVLDSDLIRAVHGRSGHPDIKHTLYKRTRVP